MGETQFLPLLPTREFVLFPRQMAPLVVGRPKSILAVDAAIAGDRRVFLALQRDAAVRDPQAADLSPMGVIATIKQWLKLPDGNLKVLVEGVDRARMLRVSESGGHWLAEVQAAALEESAHSPELRELRESIGRRLRLYSRQSNELWTEQADALAHEEDPGVMADLMASNLPLSLEQRQSLLEISDPADRLRRVAAMFEEQFRKLPSQQNLQYEGEIAMLRHTVATLAYRGAKAMRGAPPEFAIYKAASDSRTPGEILAHMGDLFDWALAMANGRFEWHDSPALPWDEGMARFFAVLQKFDERLSASEPLGVPAEKLFQGPIADALTHVGQIAMLRRMAGHAMRGENYFVADIAVGRVGFEQATPVKEFE